MKRKVITMLCVCAALFAAGCSSAPNAPDTGNSRENTEAVDVSGNDTGEAPAVTAENGKILVAYFSWADNAVLDDDVDAVSSPSVIPPGNVQQLAGWVQEEIRSWAEDIISGNM